jgi:hypothetical protein
MTRLGEVAFNGASGKEYKFDMYSLDTGFKESTGAVYFVTNRTIMDMDVGHKHRGIYVGETNDLSMGITAHPKYACFLRHEANCLGIYDEESERTRLAIQRDLIDAYEPPCND